MWYLVLIYHCFNRTCPSYYPALYHAGPYWLPPPATNGRTCGQFDPGAIGGWISTSSCQQPGPPTWTTWSLPAWGRVASTSSVRMEGRGIWYGNMTIIYNNNIYDELFQQQCLIVTWVFEHILPIFVSEELRFQWVGLFICLWVTLVT